MKRAIAFARFENVYARRVARRRSLVVLAIFTTAMLVAFVAPRLSFAPICAALIFHARPDLTNR